MSWVEDELQASQEKAKRAFAKMSLTGKPEFLQLVYHNLFSKICINEIGPKLLSPYHDNAKDIVKRYVSYHEQQPEFPSFHGFVSWYCDSGTIKREVDREREKAKVIPMKNGLFN